MSEQTDTERTPTAQLVAFAASSTFDDLPSEVIDHAKLMLRDVLGVTLAATGTDAFERALGALRPELSGSDMARVPGTERAGPTRPVALLNGVLAHALDFDDVHPQMGGHPTAPVASSLFAIADSHGLSGEEFLRAFVVGVETELALAAVLNPGHYERGWHPTAVLGTVGAAVAAGVARGHDEERLHRTIGVSVSQAGGVKANFGTMTKAYHVGDAAASGVEAARLADEGFTANPDALGADFGGYLALFEGNPPNEIDDRLDRLGELWRLRSPPVGFKPYPCCGSTHGAIDAALTARERLGGVSPGSVTGVRIRTHPRRLGHTNRPAPTTRLDAKFSIQYCVVAALLGGDVWFDDFDARTVGEPDRRRLLEAVFVEEDAAAFADDPWGAEVTVEMADSRESVRVAAPTGSGDAPISSSELSQKYERCAGRALPDDQIAASMDALGRLEALDNVTALLDTVVP